MVHHYVTKTLTIITYYNLTWNWDEIIKTNFIAL